MANMFRAWAFLAAAHAAGAFSVGPRPAAPAAGATQLAGPRLRATPRRQGPPDLGGPRTPVATVVLEEATERLLTHSEVAEHKHLIVIRGNVYNVSSYLRKHPGGSKVFDEFFYGGDATEAFEDTTHSKGAMRMLEKLKVGRLTDIAEDEASEPRGTTLLGKFFTKEDPIQFHKTFGVYVLLHYIYRLCRIAAGDPTGGFTTSWASLASVVPHAVLSCSAFKFHVPRERVVGKPMIWQEFRAHNVGFALRSFVAFVMLWAAQRARQHWGIGGASLAMQGLAVVGTGAASIGAMFLADYATRKLRENSRESTTATMPYWQGCSGRTQSRFKAFYAFAQVMATWGNLAVLNLSWPFLIMMPIQLASLLMTCVRKGALSTRGYHYIYTISLIIPFFVGLRTEPRIFPFVAAAGLLVYAARTRLPRGAARPKYYLWSSAVAARVVFFAARGA